MIIFFLLVIIVLTFPWEKQTNTFSLQMVTKDSFTKVHLRDTR